MKNTVYFLLVFIFLTSCKCFQGDHCNNTKPIAGVYKNIFDKEAKNILNIKNNGTFEQVFTKNGQVIKNLGEWSFYEENCNVDLKGLKLMHELGKYEKEEFKEEGLYRLNNIIFNEDLGREFDFYRIK